MNEYIKMDVNKTDSEGEREKFGREIIWAKFKRLDLFTEYLKVRGHRTDIATTTMF